MFKQIPLELVNCLLFLLIPTYYLTRCVTNLKLLTHTHQRQTDRKTEKERKRKGLGKRDRETLVKKFFVNKTLFKKIS